MRGVSPRSSLPKDQAKSYHPIWDEMQMQAYQLEAFLSEPFPNPPVFFCCTTVHGYLETEAGPLLCLFSRKTALSTQQNERLSARMREVQQAGRLEIVVVDEPLSYEQWKDFAWDQIRASAVVTELLAVKKYDHRLMLLNATKVFVNDEMNVARSSNRTGRNYPEGTVYEICAHCSDVIARHPDGDCNAIRYDMLMGPHSGYR